MTIQSLVSTGFVGNNMATFVIQSFGIDVLMLPTVLFSTHADQNEYYGAAISPDLFKTLCKGITVSETYKYTYTTLSGYINSVELIDLTASLLAEWKKNDKTRLYIYDPVFGDTRTNGLYIDEQVVRHSITKLLPLSDVFTPNHFELEYIRGEQIKTVGELTSLIAEDPEWMNRKTILTSAELTDISEGEVETILIENGRLTRFSSERIPIDVVGTGDLFNACLAAFLAKDYSLEQAIPKSMYLVTDVLRYLYDNKLPEINAAALCHVLQASNNEDTYWTSE